MSFTFVRNVHMYMLLLDKAQTKGFFIIAWGGVLMQLTLTITILLAAKYTFADAKIDVCCAEKKNVCF